MDFTVVTKLLNVYGFGACCQGMRDICMDFEPCLKFHTLISVQHKSINFGQIIHLYIIFHLVVSNYHLKCETQPSFPHFLITDILLEYQY